MSLESRLFPSTAHGKIIIILRLVLPYWTTVYTKHEALLISPTPHSWSRAVADSGALWLTPASLQKAPEIQHCRPKYMNSGRTTERITTNEDELVMAKFPCGIPLLLNRCFNHRPSSPTSNLHILFPSMTMPRPAREISHQMSFLCLQGHGYVVGGLAGAVTYRTNSVPTTRVLISTVKL